MYSRFRWLYKSGWKSPNDLPKLNMSMCFQRTKSQQQQVVQSMRTKVKWSEAEQQKEMEKKPQRHAIKVKQEALQRLKRQGWCKATRWWSRRGFQQSAAVWERVRKSGALFICQNETTSKWTMLPQGSLSHLAGRLLLMKKLNREQQLTIGSIM